MIWTSQRKSVSPPPCLCDITKGYFTLWKLFFLLHHLGFQQVPLLTPLRPSSASFPRSVAPSHLSSFHLPATNHNLFTTPQAHSTTLLAPIADLFIPDNAEGWRLWFETWFAECISHGLTAWAPHSLGLIDVILSRAELFRAVSVRCGWCVLFSSFFLTMQRDDKEEEIFGTGLHSKFSSRARWEATSGTSVDAGK